MGYYDISEELRRQSILLVDSTIPPHLTIADWRRGQRPRVRRRRLGIGAWPKRGDTGGF